MITFTKTRSAADYISRHTTSDLARSRALVLVKRLGVCEAALAAEDGDPALAYGLLRGLVRTVRELAGPTWLSANTDDPDIARLHSPWTTHPPPHPRLTSTNSSPGCYGPASHRAAVIVASQANRRVPAHCQPMTTGGRATTRSPTTPPTLTRGRYGHLQRRPSSTGSWVHSGGLSRRSELISDLGRQASPAAAGQNRAVQAAK
jgi:hypothetical protein